MADVSKQRTVLLKDCLPIIAVEFRIVEILALNSPGLTINLFPLSARIDAHFHLGQVYRAIANPYRRRAIGSNDSPTGSAPGSA